MIQEISASEVEDLIKAGINKVILDVREVDEVEEGKIKGAMNIPLGTLSARIDELDKDQEYILVCRSGKRSMVASEILTEAGFSVWNMTGGMCSWRGQVEVRV